MKKILFDETHGEVSRLVDTSQSGLSLLNDELRKAGYKIEALTNAPEDASELLKDVSVLWVSFPTREFEGDEKERILEFVKGGGGLLLTAEWGDLYGNVNKLNEIAKSFGMTFRMDRVTDVKNSYTEKIEIMGESVGVARIPQFLVLKNFKKHPMTEGVKEIGYFAGCSIESTRDRMIVWSGADSFGDLNANAKWDPGERIGEAGLVCAAEHGKGRVVCVGDTSLITNKYIRYADNGAFTINTMKWLAKDV